MPWFKKKNKQSEEPPQHSQQRQTITVERPWMRTPQQELPKETKKSKKRSGHKYEEIKPFHRQQRQQELREKQQLKDKYEIDYEPNRKLSDESSKQSASSSQYTTHIQSNEHNNTKSNEHFMESYNNNNKRNHYETQTVVENNIEIEEESKNNSVELVEPIINDSNNNNNTIKSRQHRYSEGPGFNLPKQEEQKQISNNIIDNTTIPVQSKSGDVNLVTSELGEGNEQLKQYTKTNNNKQVSPECSPSNSRLNNNNNSLYPSLNKSQEIANNNNNSNNSNNGNNDNNGNNKHEYVTLGGPGYEEQVVETNNKNKMNEQSSQNDNKENKEDKPSAPPLDEKESNLDIWLKSIGFKNKKLKIILEALEDMGIEDLDELKMVLTEMYKNSFGQQQKSWIDKMQGDLSKRGIKWAQWIRFSTGAKRLVGLDDQSDVSKINKQPNSDPTIIQGTSINKNNNDKNINPHMKGSGQVVVMIQEDESRYLNELQISMINLQDGLERLQKVILGVDENEKKAIENVEKEFKLIIKSLDDRKEKLIESIHSVASEKFHLLEDQNKDLSNVMANYQETMATFNRILAKNQHVSKENLKKRSDRIAQIVTKTLSQRVTTTPIATPLIGFGCNINPVIQVISKLGEVTWGNPPQAPYIANILVTDWCIQVFWSDNTQEHHRRSNAIKNNKDIVLTDPIIQYEIQFVECTDDEDVSDIFPNDSNNNINNDNSNNIYNKTKYDNKSPRRNKKNKKAKFASNLPVGKIMSKYSMNKYCILSSFISNSKCYAIRVRGQNRNGWGYFSNAKGCRTKRKKKRKVQQLNSVKIGQHKGHYQEGHPNNLLFSNSKLLYNSLSNSEFEISRKNDPKYGSYDWISFDLGNFIELSVFRIKYDTISSRYGNVPAILSIEIADSDIDAKLIFNKYNYNNNSNLLQLENSITDETGSDSDDDNNNNNNNNESKQDKQNTQKLNNEKELKEKEKKETRKQKEERKRKLLEQKQLELKKCKDEFMKREKIWRKLAKLEAKKKSGWQDFNLESINLTKRRGRYIRLKFIENYDCNIEHMSRYVIEQVAFIGITFQLKE